MVDDYGRWKENEDYSTFPQEDWCDMDYVANWIRSKNYEPKTSMENLILMILAHYDTELECTFHEDGRCTYGYAIPDERPYPENLMVYIPDLEAYVEASGGIQEFDHMA